ncbi:MAG: LAGLIDADG family homing endonuclease, partial [Candidatus Heimdallarchaeota archaeon]
MDIINIERFRDFFQGYQDENGRYIYIEQIQRMSLEGLTSLIVDYDDLLRFDPELAGKLRRDEEQNIDPESTIKEADSALEDVLKIEDRSYVLEAQKKKEAFHVRFFNIPMLVNLRRLRAVHLGHFIAIEGIIIRQSVVKPLLVEGKFQCNICGEAQTISQEEGIYREPSFCVNPECGKKGLFNLLAEESKYTDLQSISIQERPETLPPGQIPRTVPARLVGDLVDTVRAGDRAIAFGILKMKKAEKRGRLATFDPWLDVNFISSREKEFEEIEIDPDTEQQIIELSRDLSIHRRIIRSIAPSIYGMEIIKEALATVLFGGVSRVAPDGMKQRGESNILIVGDPGVAKSQLLQFIYRLAPRGLLTSGKASSAAGLTAAVLRDPETGEFALEAGALVLADRGICAIDEFDKMNPIDRSSIHEAMEQQSYHPSFEISLLDGDKQQIGDFVDGLFDKYNENKIDGKNCEILPTNDLEFKVLTTNFQEIYNTHVNRVSRHLAPDNFIKITYSNGREIIVTPEHPIYVMHKGKIKTIEAEEVSENLFVPGVRYLDYKNSSSLVTDFDDGRKNITLPNNITEDLAKFLGYYIAEGYSYKGSSLEVGLSNTNPEIVEDMIQCIKSTFNTEPINYVEQNRTIRIISMDVYNYLIKNFPEMMLKSFEKRVDKKIFCLEDHKIVEFLKAAFKGDGSIESTSIAYSTSSKGLADDYQDLLLTLGINSRIFSEEYSFGRKKKQKRIRYKVYITGDCITKYCSMFFELPEKNPKLKKLLIQSKRTNRRHDVLPPDVAHLIIDSLHSLGMSYDGYFYQHLKNNYGITTEVINKYYVKITGRYYLLIDRIYRIKSLKELRNYVGYSISKMAKLVGFSRNTLSKYEKIEKKEFLSTYQYTIKKQLDQVRKNLVEIDNLREFRWIRIKKIERVANNGDLATKWVYDVTIEPTENFISHGLVLHNTVSIAKAGIVAQLNARTAIIAAANPRFGRYEDTRPPVENINLPPTILSRFDLLFVIKDEPNEEVDRKMARHILELRRGHILEVAEPAISMELLRKYISYA